MSQYPQFPNGGQQVPQGMQQPQNGGQMVNPQLGGSQMQMPPAQLQQPQHNQQQQFTTSPSMPQMGHQQMPQQQQFNQQPQQQPQQQQLQPRFHLQQQQYTQQHQQLGQNMQPQIQLTHTQPLQQQQYNGGNVQQQNMSQMPPVRAPMPQLGGNTATNSVFPPQQQRQQQQQQQQGFQSQGQTQDQNRPAMSQLGGNALNNSGFPPQQQLGMPQMPTQGGQQMPTQGGQQMPQHGMPPMPNSGFPQAPMKKPMLTMRDVIPPHVKPVDPKYLSVTVNAFPADANVRQRSNLPFGIILRPLAVSPAKSHDEDAIPVVTFPAECKVVRCSSCRSYINPFVTFLDGGARWRCSLCHYNNVTPKSYQCGLDQNNVRTDVGSRGELTHCTMEIIAPVDYMLRQPMAPTFCFVIETSQAAVRSGMLETVCQTLLKNLDHLPGGKRTQIAFITYDSRVHFYALRAESSGPKMFVISDLADIFLPVESGLLVNLTECREQVEMLLESLPHMHKETTDVECVLGPAIDAATKVIYKVGGKMQVFSSSLPSLGTGRLKNREDARLLGGSNEHKLLEPALPFYTRCTNQLIKYQISCNLFMFGDHFTDVATLSELSMETGGQVFYYPSFRANLHKSKLKNELIHDLTRVTGWEAVVRTRVSRGCKISNYRGSFKLKPNDLLVAPVIDSDKTVSMTIENDDTTIPTPSIVIQSALLYTTSYGERRIRVTTHCIPVAHAIRDLFPAVNTIALVAHLAVECVGNIKKEGFAKARGLLRSRCYNIFHAARSVLNPQILAPEQIARTRECLGSLPLFVLAMLKNRAFRSGTDVRIDSRATLLCAVRSMSLIELETFFRPRLIPVHEISQQFGKLTGYRFQVNLPNEIGLSLTELKQEGAYLIDNGMTFFLRVGSRVSPQFMEEIFDAKQETLRAPTDDSGSSVCARFQNILKHLRDESPHYQQLIVIKEGASTEIHFFSQLIEDRVANECSLREFLQDISRQTGFSF